MKAGTAVHVLTDRRFHNLIFTVRFTECSEAEPSKSVATETDCCAGYPCAAVSTLTTDRGQRFKSEKFDGLCSTLMVHR